MRNAPALVKSAFLMNFLTGLLLALAPSGCTKSTPVSAPAKEVSLGIWANTLAPGTLEEFERRSGIKVRVSHYSSNEELLAKLQAGASGYDVISPSDYMVQAMSKLGLLRKLERARLSNFAALDARFLKRGFDPSNEYSVPYDVGTTGIAVNRALYSGPIRSWKDLFGKPELAGKFSLLDDSRETIGAALKALGFSLNSRDAEQLRKAKELLIGVRSKVRAFDSETLAALKNGEIAVAHSYVSDALQARKATGGKIDYILPEEGGTLWIDNLVIPATAAHLEEAHALIDYLLEARVGAATAQAIFVAPANAAALKFLPAGFAGEFPALFPAPAALARLEMIEDLGEATLAWDRAWTEIKAER
ncbi:MAG: spermidine/putrescine ABC transporter substrate-binding protein [Oligoflexia bacterium]|nr:spermidine/putrescine ABC transporter substrate-binding protein [Oligoflexia bacterium]